MMLKKLFHVLIFLLAAPTLAVEVVTTTPPEHMREPLSQMENRFEQLVRDNRRAGIVWMVAYRGQVISSGAVGMQDRERGIPVSSQSTFRLFSMSRAITSVAALRLIEEGSVGLDDALSKYLTEFAGPTVLINPQSAGDGVVPASRELTIRDLLTYTAGFGYARDYPADLKLDRAAILGLDLSIAEGSQTLARFPLLHQPGARWHYGFASDVLGRVIEVVTGDKLDVAISKLVLQPLQMTDTGFNSSAERLARAYSAGATGLVDITDKLPPSSNFLGPGRMHSGGGGLVSSALDYLKFCEMLRQEGLYAGGRLLQQSTIREMVSNQISAQQGPLFWHEAAASPVMQGGGWGLGVGVRVESIATDSLLSPAGEIFWGGLAGTGFFIHPRHEVSAVVMSQYLGPDGDDLALILRKGVYEALAVTKEMPTKDKEGI